MVSTKTISISASDTLLKGISNSAGFDESAITSVTLGGSSLSLKQTVGVQNLCLWNFRAEANKILGRQKKTLLL